MGYVSQVSLLAMAVAFLNIGTLLVICRAFIRRMQKMRHGIDDYLLYPALGLMIAMCINMITAVAYARMGVSVAPRVDADGTIDPDWGYSEPAAQHEQFTYVHEILFPLQLACAKLSVLFFYRRVLCPDTRGFFHWATYVTIIVTAIWGFLMHLAFVFQCGTHFYLIWDGPMVIAGDMCLGLRLEAAMAISDFLLDLVILLLPIRRIFTLQMRTGKKFLVASAFALAGLTVTASLIRSLVLETVLKGVSNDFTGSDEAMVNSTALYWGLMESGLSVIVACLPSLQYLIVVALPQHIAKSFSNTPKGSGYSSGSSGLRSQPIKKANIQVRKHDSLESGVYGSFSDAGMRKESMV